MKKLIFVLAASAAILSQAEEAKPEEVLVEQKAPLFWGFGNYGLYSGYQLYGSLVNNEPTMQGYAEGNYILPSELGYAGLGLWSNSDLTNRRRCNGLGQLFNEWDPNVHVGRTFWFDEDRAWGLDWRSTVVWFYYPAQDYKGWHPASDTTWDFDHSFALLNPYVVPFVSVVREYRFGANLIDFGLKRSFQITDSLSVTPMIEFVWRESQYHWCFPTAFDSGYPVGAPSSNIATGKIQLDVNYQISEHFGLFAKVAFCSIIDPDLRDNVDTLRALPHDWYSYGDTKDFAWGGIGASFNF